MEVKIYRKSYLRTKPEIEAKIEELESYLQRSREELIVLASIVPESEKDCEGEEMPLHHTIPRTVGEIVESIEDTASGLYFFRCALEALESFPEDIVFDD